MNVSGAISNGSIDAGIGLENVQMVESEDCLAIQGRPTSDVQRLRIDELAKRGCCCFRSILYIGNDKFVAASPEKLAKFMRARKKATDYVLANPKQAFANYVAMKPIVGTPFGPKVLRALRRLLF